MRKEYRDFVICNSCQWSASICRLWTLGSNGGVTFSSPVQVESRGNARAPAITVSGVNVYVAWQDFSTSPIGADSEIFFAASIDGGNTFSAPINLSNNPPTLSRFPSIAASGNNVYVVWSDCKILD